MRSWLTPGDVSPLALRLKANLGGAVGTGSKVSKVPLKAALRVGSRCSRDLRVRWDKGKTSCFSLQSPGARRFRCCSSALRIY